MKKAANSGLAGLLDRAARDPDSVRSGREFVEFVRAAEAEALRQQVDNALEEIRNTKPNFQ